MRRGQARLVPDSANEKPNKRLRRLQRKLGLPETGFLDEVTSALPLQSAHIGAEANRDDEVEIDEDGWQVPSRSR